MPGKSVSIWIDEILFSVIDEIVKGTGLNRSAVINALVYKALVDLGVDVEEASYQGALATIQYYIKRNDLSG